ncbi:MAG TPA: hypothetical protein VN428_11215 [Bryobacteraceae bacterium]|nr:hypothetical protein [Bryobacteraceae bacterium]
MCQQFRQRSKSRSTATRRLNEFSEYKGHTSLPQWTTPDVGEFRDSWSVAPRTTAKHLSIIKAR